MRHETGRRNRDRLGDPPQVGPFARLGWDELNARWHVALTAAGHAMIDEYLKEYPMPLAVIKTLSPGLFGYLLRADQINRHSDAFAEAMYGITLAATTFDPGISASFSTHACWAIYNRVGVGRRLDLKRVARGVWSLDAPGLVGTPHDVPARPDGERGRAEAVEADRALLAEIFAKLPAADAETLAGQFGVGSELVDTAVARAAAAGRTRNQQVGRERAAVRRARYFLGLPA